MKQCYQTDLLEAGLDEVARGCLFGRVYAAAVIWNPEIVNPDIKDSKKLSRSKRAIVKDFIEDNAIDFSVSYVEAAEIDRVNILNASIKAMHQALDDLSVVPDMLLVDGDRFKVYVDNFDGISSYQCVPKGDDTFVSIAAASILAKEAHDQYIRELCEDNEEYRRYDLLNNMGYGTKNHLDAIAKYGLSDLHRKSFRKGK